MRRRRVVIGVGDRCPAPPLRDITLELHGSTIGRVDETGERTRIRVVAEHRGGQHHRDQSPELGVGARRKAERERAAREIDDVGIDLAGAVGGHEASDLALGVVRR